MKYYIIAGEASGDLHGSNLMKALGKTDPEAQFRAWGGDRMKRQGAELVRHYKDLAFMGFIEVVMNLRTILRNIAFCKKDIVDYQPDAVILIDYPGFNLRIAGFAHRKGFPVFYYISPQVWAWKKSRVHKIKKFVTRMFVILPFEKEFYRSFGYEVDFVGHPLLDEIGRFPMLEENEFRQEHGLDDKPLVALLPGSRRQEIKVMLPLMLACSGRFPGHTFVVAAAPSIDLSFYESLMEGSDVNLIRGQTYELLAHAHAALITSGTATLETALFNVPEVVCYKGNPLSYRIARMLVDRKFIRYISLVNLVMGREVVKELIQEQLTVQNLVRELLAITEDQKNRQRMLRDYSDLREKLGASGASEATAKLIIAHLR